MATSSIKASFDITDSIKAESFVNALKKSERDFRKYGTQISGHIVTDREEIRNLFKKEN